MQQIDCGRLWQILKKTRENPEIEARVMTIIEAVRKQGDRALLEFTRRFDRASISSPVVPEEMVRSSRRYLTGPIKQALQQARRRIERYHQAQLPAGFVQKETGCEIRFCWDPIRSVGLYIPASQAPLVSSVLMTAIPAKVAGCREIVAATPPGPDGQVNPYLLATLDWLGVKKIFRMGGAQAIAAMAFGTETVPRVDKVAGPGSAYVNTAKRLLFGQIGLDTLAGPSELVVFADDSGQPELIAADLASQMEHTGGTGIFITTSARLGQQVASRLKSGYWLLVPDRKQALRIINELAPEHLQVICRESEELLRQSLAGVILVGSYTPTALSDYFAGPSHVLPTQQAVRYTSGISVYTFLRSYAIIRAKKGFLKKWGKTVRQLALLEGLTEHAASLQVRLRGGKHGPKG